MNARGWNLLLGLLLLALTVPCAFADSDSDTESGEREGYIKKPPPEMSPEARLLGNPYHPDPPAPGSFGPDPSYEDHAYDADAQLGIYRKAEYDENGAMVKVGKHLLRTAQPFVLGRRLYDRGAYEPRSTMWGKKNPSAGHLMVYGDLRTAYAYNDRGSTDQSALAMRLNLDIDWKFTATERIHAFVRPFDQGGSTLRYEFGSDVQEEFVEEFDFNLETLYFEGDLGAMAMGWGDRVTRYDLPIAFGLVPMFTQNGIWVNDAFWGFAFALTAKNSPKLKISNYDVTFFAGFDKVTSDALVDDHDGSLIGLAGFMDVASGYIEYGYAYIDAETADLSYHNATFSWTKRYGHKLSNSIRLIGNFGQSPVPGQPKTADGLLVLIENSLITSKPSTLIPYFNLFAGFDSPQSVARAAGTGGVLNNTGINFETDGMTDYPTLDASAHEAYGGALGVSYLFNLDRQLIFEAALVDRHGDLDPLGAEYALGVRFQEPLNNAWILRLDAMHGWRDVGEDILGARVEIRRKF